jgi:ChpA-C
VNLIRKGAAVAALVGAVTVAGMGAASAESGAYGGASDSPGLLSGNNVQVPINIPINACGISVNIIGLLNPASGNTCVNSYGNDYGWGRHHDHHHRYDPWGDEGDEF